MISKLFIIIKQQIFELILNIAELENITIDEDHKDLIKANTRFYNAGGITLAGGISDFVMKTESVDAILRGGISFYNPNNLSRATATVNELANFQLFEHFAQAQNAGLAISIHFTDFSGLKENTKLYYQEQEIGQLFFNFFKRGIFSMQGLNLTILLRSACSLSN